MTDVLTLPVADEVVLLVVLVLLVLVEVLELVDVLDVLVLVEVAPSLVWTSNIQAMTQLEVAVHQTRETRRRMISVP